MKDEGTDGMGIPAPIIRLEVNRMKHTMLVALSEYAAQVDEMLRSSIEAYCTPDNLQRVIDKETQRTLDAVIREEVKNWFTYGEGREVIKKALEQKLDETWGMGIGD